MMYLPFLQVWFSGFVNFQMMKLVNEVVVMVIMINDLSSQSLCFHHLCPSVSLLVVIVGILFYVCPLPPLDMSSICKVLKNSCQPMAPGVV